MDGVSEGRDLEIPRTRGGESVDSACVWESRCDGGCRDVVWIEGARRLAFGMLGFDLGGRFDARHAGHPGE